MSGIPLHFEENRGQTDSRVQYIARGAGYTVFLTPSETVLALRSGRTQPAASSKKKTGPFTRPDRNNGQKISVLRMKLAGANASPVALPSDKLPGTVNYFLGHDSRKWRTGIPTYARVQYLDVYSGIDLVFHSSQNQLEYDFVVNPGADPQKIAFSFEGASALVMAASGDMHLDSSSGKLTAHKPQIYQLQNGQRKQLSGNFVMRDAHTIGVDVKNFDHTKPLVIDPVLSYSTYLGGSSLDEGDAIAVDQQGNAYVAGDTTSVDFPITGTSISPAPSSTTIAFVTKLNSSGTGIVYSTYLGGTTSDVPFDLTVDANGYAYVTGLTSSTDFPVTTSAYQSSLASGAVRNAFVSKLAADGASLLYSTFLGGGADDEGTGVAVDASGTAYISGYASSPGFPVTASNAYQTVLNSPNGNAFLLKIDTTKSGASSLVYSTFLGGTSPSAFADLNAGDFGGDSAYDVAIDSNQNAYIVGEASSTDFPVTAGAFQSQGNASNCAFVSQIDTSKSGSASLVYSTYLCGTNNVYGDYGTGIAIDPQNNIYVTGNSWSTNFPAVAGTSSTSATQKPFVAKLNTANAGSASLLYAMRFGGSSDDSAFRIACDSLGVAYVTGSTLSTDFPVTSDAVQTTKQNPGASDGFLAAVSPTGASLLYATYLGGSTGGGDYVLGVAVDSSDNVYLTGATSASDFPTTSGSFQTAANGSTDGFVTQISGIVSAPQISSISPAIGGIGTSVTLTGSSFGTSQGSSVKFNGIAAPITNWSTGTITARVPAGLNPGTATIVLNGNSGSSNGVQFTVTNPLFVTPNQVTMFVGDQRPMQLLDENGALITNPNWTFDDNSIGEIIPPTNPGDPILLQADAVGTTTITASNGNRTGITKITVLPAGASLPIGSVQWEIPSLGSGGIRKTVQALRIDDNTPDLYAQDDGAQGGNGAIRAFSANGQQKWIWPSTPSDKFPLLAAADNQGGAIYFASQDTPGPYSSYCYFGRVDQNGNETWQYQESNCDEDYAIAPDGTIFLVEDSYQNTDTTVVSALDPTTGQIKFTVPLPASSQNTDNADEAHLNPTHPDVWYCSPGAPGVTNTATLATHGAISISSDGIVYIPFTAGSSLSSAQPCDTTITTNAIDQSENGLPQRVKSTDGHWSASSNLQMMVIHSDGSYSSQQFDANSASGTGMNASGVAGFFGMGRAIPDGQGGSLLTLSFPAALYHSATSGTSKFPLSITPPQVFDGFFDDDSTLLGEDGTAYLTGSSDPNGPMNTILALDTSTGATKWSASPGLDPKLSSLIDGSTAFEYSQSNASRRLAIANSAGQISPLFANPADGTDVGPLTSASTPLISSYFTLDTWLVPESDGGLGAITGNPVDQQISQRPTQRANAQGQNSPSIPQIMTVVPFYYAYNTQTGDPVPLTGPNSYGALITRNLQPNAVPLFRFLGQATYRQFKTDVESRSGRLGALGYVGHSFLLGNPATSVGLCFQVDPKIDDPSLFTKDCIVQTDFTTSFDPFSGSKVVPEFVTRFTSTTKVIFIAACDISDSFVKLWNVNQDPTTIATRALIIPDSTEVQGVNTLDGASVWDVVAQYLSQGHTVNEAKDAANTFAQSISSVSRWKVVGNGNLRIRPKTY